ncbi:hypothetical protein V8E54_012744, partial [Elaphomyces granulatus]
MPNHKVYTVGWICAISTEYVAAKAFLDEMHERPEILSRNDSNDYTLGEVAGHNVVVAVLPDGEYGTSSAASVAIDMLRSFPDIRIGLMVGIGGGAPSRKNDIRLGDIVVSTPRSDQGGVFQYDFGKTIQGQSFQPTGFLNQPPTVLRTAVNGLKAEYETEGHQLEDAINGTLEKKPKLRKKYKRPDPDSDRLYQSHVLHLPNDESSCAISCGDNPSNLILRAERTEDEDNPMIHYGLIASGNQLMKDALIRDNLAVEKNVLCFEMEAAGLMNRFPCLVIRGICDYADSHKNKDWQGYAAMAAAAYTNALLRRIVPQRVETEERISDILYCVKTGIDEIQKTTQDTNCTVKKLSQHGDDQKCQEIVDWLTPVNYAPQQSDFIARRQEGTGEWLLQSNEFQQWVNRSNQTLFCPGMPGAGKTILSSIIIDHLCKEFGNDHTIGIAYLYCNFRQHHEQKSSDLIVSLLKQLVQEQSPLPDIVKNLYSDHTLKRTRPSPDVILSTLHHVTACYSRAFIIIDALDECQVSHEGRGKFLQEIFNLQVKTGVNIFATSRFIQEIENQFNRSIKLEIRASDADMQKYLDGKLQNSQSWVLKNHYLQEEIKSRIAKAADGMFLLAQLYVDSLAYKTTPKAIKLALGELDSIEAGGPNVDKTKILDHAYVQAMERIEAQAPEHRDLARQVLSWITCAKRRLTSSELQHAIAIEINNDELDRENITDIELLVSVCTGLVIVDEESDIVRLVHYTTQEYFKRTWERWFPNAHTDVTEKCATYLLFKVFKTGFSRTRGDFEKRLQSNALYDYAARNWGYHARISSTEEGKLVLGLLESATSISACSQVMTYSQYRELGETKMTGAHLAAYFGLGKTMSALPEKLQDVNRRDKDGRTPLSYAASNGHEAVVKLLLDNNADIESKDHDSRTPLLYAAWNGHEAVVKLLLDNNANIESKDHDGRTPLLYAAWCGYEAVVKLLLDNNANIESNDNAGGGTPLSYA